MKIVEHNKAGDGRIFVAVSCKSMSEVNELTDFVLDRDEPESKEIADVDVRIVGKHVAVGGIWFASDDGTARELLDHLTECVEYLERKR